MYARGYGVFFSGFRISDSSIKPIVAFCGMAAHKLCIVHRLRKGGHHACRNLIDGDGNSLAVP